MIQGSELPILSNWQNFYMIMGTAAAILTGLMFVVTTLIAGIDAHRSTLNAAVSAFNTPTVVHFGAVLLLPGVLSAPWQTFSSLSLLLGLLGLGMVYYSILVLRRLWGGTSLSIDVGRLAMVYGISSSRQCLADPRSICAPEESVSGTVYRRFSNDVAPARRCP